MDVREIMAKPCPFCGEELTPWTDEEEGGYHPDNDCFISGCMVEGHKADKWNRRA